jgi:16S rRNA (guanine527-N7)-methyltransferase
VKGPSVTPSFDVADDSPAVSRETFGPASGRPAAALEAEPAAATQVFGDHIELARRFTTDLAQHGERLGLIGPLEAARLWSRHIINCAVVAPFLQAGGRVADVGSGAGLPGIVLAIARPDVHLVLIEPMERRTDWLLAETERLGLTNVSVLRARAEEVPGTGALDEARFDQVTARAVSALTKLIPLVVPLVRDGGELLFLKGARVHDEVAAAASTIRRHHLHDIEVLELGSGLVPEVTRLFRATVGEAS